MQKKTILNDDSMNKNLESLLLQYQKQDTHSGNVLFGDGYFMLYSVNMGAVSDKLNTLLGENKDVIIVLSHDDNGYLTPFVFERGLYYDVFPLEEGEK